MDIANHQHNVMTSGHWYGIAFLGGALLGFFVFNRVSNQYIDSIYTSGWKANGGIGS